jgi:hypothetical protein
MSAVAQHDYVGRVREEVGTLEADLSERDARAELARTVERLGVPSELALAAIYRAARRSGISLRLMLTEINGQLDRGERPGG